MKSKEKIDWVLVLFLIYIGVVVSLGCLAIYFVFNP